MTALAAAVALHADNQIEAHSTLRREVPYFFEQMRPPVDERSLLALLGVDERAAWDEVRRAFRMAVRASHPDLHVGDPDAEQRLKALNGAWESVNTPSKWAAYRTRTASGISTGSSAPPPGSATAQTVGRLRVQRQQRGSVGLVNWKIELDGEVVASIENGGTSVCEAGPGRHVVRVFYGSRSSVPLPVELHRGQELMLGCRQLESLRHRLLSPNGSLAVEVLGSRRFE